MSSEDPVLDFLVLLDRHRNGIAEELNRRNDELHCLDLALDQIDERLPGVVKTKNGALRRGLTFQSLRQALTDARQAPKGTELTYDVDVLPSQPDKVNVGKYMSLLEEEIKALDDQLWEHPLMVAAHWVNDKTTKELCLEEIVDTAARYTGSAFALASRKQRIRPDSVEVIGERFVEGRCVISVVPFAPEVIAEELRDLKGVPQILRALDYGELERHVCGLFPWIRDLEGYTPPGAEPPQAELPVEIQELIKDLPADDTPGLRDAHRRDHLWLKWHYQLVRKVSNFHAVVRNRWNDLPEPHRKIISPRHPGMIGKGRSGAGTVQTSISKAKKELKEVKPKSVRGHAKKPRSHKKI